MSDTPSGDHDASIRPGEKSVALPDHYDAQVYFIGRIRTPWTDRGACPRRGDPQNGPVCILDIDPRWADALSGIGENANLQVLYWMDQARRDLVVQTPRHDGSVVGTFALRSPVRPNPIASSIVTLLEVEGTHLKVRGLDCLDGTPMVDLKPEHPRG